MGTTNVLGLAIERRLGCRQQEATQLANVLNDRAVGGANVLPETRGRELLAEHQGASRVPAEADTDHATSRVVQRQGTIDTIAFVNAVDASKA